MASKKAERDVAPTSTLPVSRHSLGIRRAAYYLDATPWFVEELIRDGAIPFRQVGPHRVLDADDLDAWLLAQPKLRSTGGLRRHQEGEAGNKEVLPHRRQALDPLGVPNVRVMSERLTEAEATVSSLEATRFN